MGDNQPTPALNASQVNVAGRSAMRKKLPLPAAIAIASISIVVCGLGVAAMVSSYVPERSTRFGLAPALSGPEAMHYGSSIVLTGLVPLLAFARHPRAVAWLGSLLALALGGNVFFGARFWA